MRIDAHQNALMTIECQLVASLPENLREPWATARNTFIAVPRPQSPDGRKRVVKAQKPMGYWAPATAVMVMTNTMIMVEAGKQLVSSVPLECMNEPEAIEQLLDGPLLAYGGPTRALYLTQCGVFRSRVLGLDSSNMARAAKRVLASEPPKDRSACLKTYEVYHQAALSLDPRMEPGEEHLLDTAMPCRRAATAVIAVEVVPRKTELTGLHVEDVIIDGTQVWVFIPGRLSKTGTTQVRQLSPEGSAIVSEYCCRARPFLVSLRRDNSVPDNQLWVANDGEPLESSGVLTALTVDLAKKLKVTVSPNVLRRAMASRADLDDLEASNLLGHRDGSPLALDRYAKRDTGEAANDLLDIWSEFDD